MSAISGRQHLVPGFLDLSEDDLELSQKKSPLDPWAVFCALVLMVGMGLLFWGTRG